MRAEISESNITNIERIKGVMELEEGRDFSLNETLNRVLEFYKKFVPYN